jgi:hypothetical protein
MLQRVPWRLAISLSLYTTFELKYVSSVQKADQVIFSGDAQAPLSLSVGDNGKRVLFKEFGYMASID